MTLALLAAAPAFAQTNTTTNLTLSQLFQGVGVVQSAKVCATPADGNGKPISVTAPGWGLVLPSALCSTVTAGVMAPLPVPDANHTNALNPITYNVSIQVMSSGVPSGAAVVYTAIPGVTGPSFALDTYQPAVKVALTPANTIGGGAGVPDHCTTPSLWLSTTAPVGYACRNGTFAALGFNPRGPWAASTAYATNDVVTYGGSSYYAPTNFTSGLTFDSTWTLLASIGATGPQGPMATLTDTVTGFQYNLQMVGGLLTSVPVSAIASSLFLSSSAGYTALTVSNGTVSTTSTTGTHTPLSYGLADSKTGQVFNFTSAGSAVGAAVSSAGLPGAHSVQITDQVTGHIWTITVTNGTFFIS